MLRDLYDTLRIRYAIWQHHRQRDKHHDRLEHLTDDERAAVHATETLKDLHPGVDVQAWFRKAIHTEAFTTPEELLMVAHRVYSEGRFTQESLNRIAEQGIAIDFGHSLDERLYQAMQSAGNYGRIIRLQEAVRRLAFIAGPGFTTDHLIDEGLIHEGDL